MIYLNSASAASFVRLVSAHSLYSLKHIPIISLSRLEFQFLFSYTGPSPNQSNTNTGMYIFLVNPLPYPIFLRLKEKIFSFFMAFPFSPKTHFPLSEECTSLKILDISEYESIFLQLLDPYSIIISGVVSGSFKDSQPGFPAGLFDRNINKAFHL